MILSLETNRFTSIVQSHDTFPTSTQGATITPAQNAYGSYATVLGTPLVDPAYAIEIIVREIGVSGQDTSSLTTIGIDRAGGSSYSDFINHLLTGNASGVGGGSLGIKYRFPLFIPAGATLGAKGSINNATVGTQLVQVRLFCRPTRPDLVRCGQFVRTYGEDTANSRGTAVTFGNASEGAWTQVGTVADANLIAWAMAATPVGITTASNQRVHCDLGLGDASNKSEFVVGHEVQLTNVEMVGQVCLAEYGKCGNGDLVYARGQGTAQTTWSCAAYAVGG